MVWWGIMVSETSVWRITWCGYDICRCQHDSLSDWAAVLNSTVCCGTIPGVVLLMLICYLDSVTARAAFHCHWLKLGSPPRGICGEPDMRYSSQKTATGKKRLMPFDTMTALKGGLWARMICIYWVGRVRLAGLPQLLSHLPSLQRDRTAFPMRVTLLWVSSKLCFHLEHLSIIVPHILMPAHPWRWDYLLETQQNLLHQINEQR